MKRFIKKLVLFLFIKLFEEEISGRDNEPEVSKFWAELLKPYIQKEEKTMGNPSIRIECEACGGTGLYCGMCEPKGEAVVCIDCAGKGYRIAGKAFTGRKKRQDVCVIRFRGSKFMLASSSQESMTYEEFEKRISTN